MDMEKVLYKKQRQNIFKSIRNIRKDEYIEEILKEYNKQLNIGESKFVYGKGKED